MNKEIATMVSKESQDILKVQSIVNRYAGGKDGFIEDDKELRKWQGRFLMAAQIELSEVMSLFPFKWWTIPKFLKKNITAEDLLKDITEEIADILHFTASAYLISTESPILPINTILAIHQEHTDYDKHPYNPLTTFYTTDLSTAFKKSTEFEFLFSNFPYSLLLRLGYEIAEALDLAYNYNFLSVKRVKRIYLINIVLLYKTYKLLSTLDYTYESFNFSEVYYNKAFINILRSSSDYRNKGIKVDQIESLMYNLEYFGKFKNMILEKEVDKK